MNVLLDRHHAGLYRSMQLLAARLGWTLYTPVGLEWMTERYWSFGMNAGITADLANQYLVPHESIWFRQENTYQQAGEPAFRYVTDDPEFPVVDIYGVTLDEARQTDWAYVVATLDDNQWGFSRFAKEQGARFVVQVGNTGQYVDWSLDPLAIVSSEVPIVGRGVRYHQEMDPAATEYADPADALAMVSSFVNCFPSIGPCYSLWRDMQVACPTVPRKYLEGDLLYSEFGIDGAQGVIKPISLVASWMRRSLFGWHDKAHGDGFGHVIHGWAAVGRPIIGHASHYRGKMAEHLWRHGETCIDLDVVSIPEAARMMRDIAADPARHEAMCRAIRAEYDRIDHDAEARAIADLLGVAVAV